MDLSIIILNYKSRGLTRQCLKGILSSNPRLNYEIFVIDNNSRDGCLDYIKADIGENSRVKYIQSKKNRGMGAGNNIGVKLSQGKYILILNPDIAVFPGALEKMLNYLELHPEVAVLGPKLVNPQKELQYSCFHFPTPFDFVVRRINFPFGKKVLAHYQMADWDHNDTREVDWVQGSCMLVRKDAIKKVGMFDENIFLYLEDTDWCRRFWQAGFKVVFYPEVCLVHYYARGAADAGLIRSVFKKITWIHILSALKYFWKWRRRSTQPMAGVKKLNQSRKN